MRINTINILEKGIGLPTKDLTEHQKGMIGAEYPTPEGAKLKVIGVSSGKTDGGKWDRKFLVICSDCSKDSEIFSEPFCYTKGQLDRGAIPCLCSKRFTPTDSQDMILMQRYLKEHLPQFKVISVEVRKGYDKKFILECESCSQDKELWPAGSIILPKGELTRGTIPCGCHPTRTYWSEDQYEILIKRECAIRDYTFLGWDGRFRNYTTKLLLTNNKTGYSWGSTSITKFLSRGQGDPQEAVRVQKLTKSFYGYYPDREEESDNLYIILFKKGGYIKIGRSFNLKERIVSHGKSLIKQANHSKNDIQILYIFKGIHREVFRTEQELHDLLKYEGYHAPQVWTGETFLPSCIDFIEDRLQDIPLKDITSSVKVL
ncbi:hypothetical protein NVP1161O_012 [Vibrio phage 1.161.O._10N.261.48.C5]|nr:hypothetical protein NVP1161O_012 [Vibrio phage 1.161.O._10N.261.48.C5]